ncbi:MAG TPA: ClpX C4-type zinc finger protein [Caulobacteraceae bacterium]|jgi:hypothetical protein|nr:ClpX C4-type zinc finger protein [Caulobacteraceae bacterium]
MRDYRDAKAMAKALRAGLSDHHLSITHSQSLELMARAFGYDNWNILAAKIDAARPALAEPPAANPAPDQRALHCSFCAKSQYEVQNLIAGPNSFICDACVALCNDIVEHSAVLALLKADDGEARVGAYLAARTPDQLRAYEAKLDADVARNRQALLSIDVAIEARADGRPLSAPFRELSDEELPGRRATLQKQLGGSLRIATLLARALEARP